ncbi:MAG: GNAT family protein [Bacteroidota bacterium]|nr:GNAT family protein [Bacteroidota bacterium]MEE3148991.1 GNAT family protein [Bacteroidota bacterium]MEE3243131.1 GNAT family protein [Bacteroidota bacterium]
MQKWIAHPLELEDDTVKLVPLKREHRDGLLVAASDGSLWELWYTSVPSAETIDAYIVTALEQQEKGEEYPFSVIDAQSGKIIGCTRFYGMQPQHKRLEIGYTWYAKSVQRTGVNTACKRLLLAYAFEQMHCIAVQIVTDWFNLRSRAAIARLGAKQDGVLRNHRINADGSYRDTVVFSITNSEWHGVKKNLDYKMLTYNCGL